MIIKLKMMTKTVCSKTHNLLIELNALNILITLFPELNLH